MRWQHLDLVGILAVASVASVGGQMARPHRPVEGARTPRARNRGIHAGRAVRSGALGGRGRRPARGGGWTDVVYLQAECPGLAERPRRGDRVVRRAVDAIMVAWSIRPHSRTCASSPAGISDGRRA